MTGLPIIHRLILLLDAHQIVQPNYLDGIVQEEIKQHPKIVPQYVAILKELAQRFVMTET